MGLVMGRTPQEIHLRRRQRWIHVSDRCDEYASPLVRGHQRTIPVPISPVSWRHEGSNQPQDFRSVNQKLKIAPLPLLKLHHNLTDRGLGHCCIDQGNHFWPELSSGTTKTISVYYHLASPEWELGDTQQRYVTHPVQYQCID